MSIEINWIKKFQKTIVSNCHLLGYVDRIVEQMHRHGKGVSNKHSIKCVPNACGKSAVHSCAQDNWWTESTGKSKWSKHVLVSKKHCGESSGIWHWPRNAKLSCHKHIQADGPSDRSSEATACFEDEVSNAVTAAAAPIWKPLRIGNSIKFWIRVEVLWSCVVCSVHPWEQKRIF